MCMLFFIVYTVGAECDQLTFSRGCGAEYDTLLGIRILGGLFALAAASLIWYWYLRTTSKPISMMYFGAGLLFELLIRIIKLFAWPAPASGWEFVGNLFEVLVGVCFVAGMWVLLKKYVKNTKVADENLLIAVCCFALIGVIIVTYTMLEGIGGIPYTTPILTTFWFVLFSFVVVMAAYVYNATREKMIMWFGIGFFMLVLASIYRLFIIETPTLLGHLCIACTFQVLMSLFILIGIFSFMRSKK